MRDNPQLKGKYIIYLDLEKEEHTIRWYSEEPHHYNFMNMLFASGCEVIDMGYVMENEFGEYLETYLRNSDIAILKRKAEEMKKQR
jgi:uncharacterized protein (DUF488 family)